jgi:hypothetical protein
MSSVLLLAKRLASAVICLTLGCGATPLHVRGDLSARHGADALTCDRLAGAEIGTGRVAPRLFASGRKSPSHYHELATAEGHAGVLSGGPSSRVVRSASIAPAFLALCARAERGPPNTTLS